MKTDGPYRIQPGDMSQLHRLAIKCFEDGTVSMSAADVRYRRLEGMRMHYGPAIPYTDDGYAMIAQVIQQTLANVMGLPLRWIQGATGIIQHPDESDADFIQRHLEDALAQAFFNPVRYAKA